MSTISVEFDNHELKALQTSPEGVQLVIDYHDCQSAEADAMELIECSRTSDARAKILEAARDAMLLERGEPAGTINLMLVDNRPYSRALVAVITEKRRIVDQEGYTPAHDDTHVSRELARAGVAYAQHYVERQWLHTGLDGKGDFADPDSYKEDEAPDVWPDEWLKAWKPKNPRRDLIRSIALLLCEVERIDRESDRLVKS